MARPEQRCNGRRTDRSLRWLAAPTLAVLLAAGCGGGTAPPPPPAVQNGQLTIDGVPRTYRVFVPPTLDRSRPAPLVLVLHGGANTAQDAVRITSFDKQASLGEFIVVYPEGTRTEWNAGSCCGSAPERNPDDVGFLTQMLDRLQRDYAVDPERVFVTGASNGAMMAYRFACERADQVRAVASVAGAVRAAACQPSRPVSVLEIHGTADPLLPYEGGRPDAVEAAGAMYPSTPAMIQRWAEIDSCPPPQPPKVSGAVTTELWRGCANDTTVSLITVQGGGHIWFTPGLGGPNGALDATGTIWRFFSANS